MDFLGRARELALLRNWVNESQTSYLTVLYGRRRIGKTRLVEEAFQDTELLKFEGLEGQSTREQQRNFLTRLAELSGKREHELMRTSSWRDILIVLSQYLSETAKHKPTVVLLDEFQWMANGRTPLVSDLKYVWDNYFLKENRTHLILCGSIGSFLVKKVIHSKALYGRIKLEMNLKQLKLPEIKEVFQPERSLREVVELYMAVGGVPQYLEMMDRSQSVKANLERLCFTPHGFLVNDFEKIFVSHFGKDTHYKKILTTLAKKAFASREELQEACNLTSGGRISGYLDDLELAGFIERYSPVERPMAVRITRYRLLDPYLTFYFRFIQPSLNRIKTVAQEAQFSRYAPDKKYDIWCGLTFERLCHQHSSIIAEKLGFSAVNYDCGSWFTRSSPRGGAQIDLLFLRDDRVITLCECKFKDEKIGRGVIAEVQTKRQALPNPKKHTIEAVLITASPPTEDLSKQRFFNRILQLDDLF